MAFEKSAVRQNVAGYLSIGGQQFSCSALHVCKSGTRKTDTFRATIPIQAGFPESFWASQNASEVQAIFSVDGQQKSMITGNIDSVEIDWIDRAVHVEGRDKAASLTETRRNKKYANQKASDIVQDIAQDNGLTAQFTASTEDVSKKFDIDTTHLILNRTDFETISMLAEREGVRWFVDGSALYFGAPETGGTYPIEYRPPQAGYVTSNAMRLSTKRNCVAAKTVNATVKSWHHKDKKLYQHTASAAGEGGTINFEHHHPGMNQQQVEKLANSHLDEKTRHELEVEIEMPGDLALDTTMQIQLTGTGTIFDQTYDIDKIDFEFEAGEHGFFQMRIGNKAKKSGRGGQ